MSDIFIGAVMLFVSVLSFGIAAALQVNHSMGGTRSDYNDGAWFFIMAGTVTLIFGVTGLVLGFLS